MKNSLQGLQYHQRKIENGMLHGKEMVISRWEWSFLDKEGFLVEGDNELILKAE